MTLVKVQTALVTTELDALALVYDRDRKWMVQQPLDDATQKAMATDVKAFFEAEYQLTDGCWKIGRRVTDRDW